MIICATGHRPKGLPGQYSRATSVALFHTAMAVLQHLQVTRVISGMALGWDQAIAQAAVELGIPFTAAVPFEGQESAWPAHSRAEYHRLLAQADEVAITCAEPGYAGWKMHNRNRWMVDKAEHVVALWNGLEKGGTWGCLKYARDQGKTRTNCWPRFNKEYQRQMEQEHDHR